LKGGVQLKNSTLYLAVADLKRSDVHIWVHNYSDTESEVRLWRIKFSCILCTLLFL